MTRWFFKVCDRLGEAVDEDGVELPALDDARALATEGARSIMADDLKNGHLDLRGSIEVTDETGSLRLLVRFSEVIAIIH